MSSSNICTISDVADVYDGPHATPKKIDEGFYFLSISSLVNGALDLSQSAFISEDDFKKWTKRVTPEYGDILFSYETRLGDAALMPDGVRACLGRRMGLLRPKREKVIPEYLLYAYLSPDFQAVIQQRKIHGATVDRIALKDLPNFPIRIPSIGEQRKVVDSLSSIDSKIQLNRQINQTLEQMAQAIFQSWFVDFEPVKAKIAAREDWLARQAVQRDAHDDAPQFSSPVCYAHEFADAAAPAPATQADLETFMNRAAMCAISGKTDADLDAMPAADYQRLYHTASLFPDELVESELGEIPKGWEVVKVDELLDRMKVKARYKKDEVNKYGSTPVYEQGADILLGFHDGMPSINATPSEPAFIFGDHTCVMFLACHGFDVSQNVIPLRGSKFSTIWTYYAVKDVQTFQEYRRHWAELIVKKVVTPTTSIADAFSGVVLGNIKFQEKLNDQKLILEQLRDSLLPKLLSGELDISALTDLAENAAEPGAAHD